MKRSNWVFQWMLALVILIGASACGGTAHFGPYQGKVIDAETGEPIEGAVVLIAFYTERHTLGGNVSRFEDAVEMLTDKNGEFKIPVTTLSVTRFMHEWSPFGKVTIFKPGYAVYPWSRTIPYKVYVPGWSLPKSEYVVISLPRLITHEERKINLFDISIGYVPIEKMRQLMKLKDIEKKNIGLAP